MAYINRNRIPLVLLKGDSAFIRYSSHPDGTDFTEEWSEGQNYIGFATGQTAPTDKDGYTWLYLAGKTNLDGKLDKKTEPTDGTYLYAVKKGKQDIVKASSEANSGPIMCRDDNGRASINTPESDSQIANKKYVDTQIANFDFIKVVSSLDAVTNPLPNKIYLVPNENSDTQNLFDEWIFVNGKWEWITTKEIDVDLTDYATIEYVDSTMEDTSDALDEIIKIQNTLVDGGNPDTSWLIDKIYPVGSIYMSVNDVDPAVIFGGNWERIQGRFLLGTGSGYGLGATGGAESVTLTKDQMPNHAHSITSDFGSGGMGRYIDNSANTGATGIAPRNYDYRFESGTRVGTVSITASGGNQAHNNMPPYLAVNMWKRTA